METLAVVQPVGVFRASLGVLRPLASGFWLLLLK